MIPASVPVLSFLALLRAFICHQKHALLFLEVFSDFTHLPWVFLAKPMFSGLVSILLYLGLC